MIARRPLIAGLSLSLALVGAAAAQGPANPAPSQVRPGVYAIEPSHTRVLFSVSHMGFTTWYGNFTGASGSLTLDPSAPSASALTVTLPIASVTTTNATLDAELKSPAWLDAAAYPTAAFRSTHVTATGPRTADVAGELTLHGVTRPIVLKVKFNAAGVNPLNKAYTAGFDATGTIKRSDFGVKTYVPLIGDDVDLIISAAFEKTPG
jgi:polyisoprenoid-binding protein YceI